jgi:hypothetical protein
MKTVKLRNQSTDTIRAKIKELSHGGLTRTKPKHARLGRREDHSTYFSHLIAEMQVRDPRNFPAPAPKPPRTFVKTAAIVRPVIAKVATKAVATPVQPVVPKV